MNTPAPRHLLCQSLLALALLPASLFAQNAAFKQEVRALGPLLYFPFDETVGKTIAQNLGQLGDGSRAQIPYTGAELQVPDQRGRPGAIFFKAQNEGFVQVHNTGNLGMAIGENGFSIGLWVRVVGSEPANLLAVTNPGFTHALNLSVNENRKREPMPGFVRLAYRYDDGVVVEAAAGLGLNDQLWHYFVVTHYNGQARFYLDGEPVSRGVENGVAVRPTGAVSNFVNPLRIGAGGRDTPDTFKFFRGAVDEVAIFARVLTPEDVASIQMTLAVPDEPSATP